MHLFKYRFFPKQVFSLFLFKGWLPWWLSSKESTCNAGDTGSVPAWGRGPGVGNGNPLQCSCLENPMDRGAWRATVHGVPKSRAWLKRVNNNSKGYTYCCEVLRNGLKPIGAVQLEAALASLGRFLVSLACPCGHSALFCLRHLASAWHQ